MQKFAGTKFIGTKAVMATSMTRGDYNHYRGWTIPADENPEDGGYLVEYLDGGQPNHPDHAGYISWSPADVFERSYKPAETFIDRMAIELAELKDRTEKAVAFSFSPAFTALDPVEQMLLDMQIGAMVAYAGTLQLRVASATAKAAG